jgi:hypothetical protein
MDMWLPHTSFRQLERELKALDDKLFLVEQRGEFGETFYEVRHWNGPEVEPSVVVDWRERDGEPKELSYGIIEEIKRMMARGPIDVQAIAERNREIKRDAQRRSAEFYEEMVREFERVATMGNFSGPVHRSQALAVARRKARGRVL